MIEEYNDMIKYIFKIIYINILYINVLYVFNFVREKFRLIMLYIYEILEFL